MQTQGGTAAEAAILAPERRFAAGLAVDWNRNGLYDHPLSTLTWNVSNVVVDRALTGSAPEEILLIEGASAAELTATLHGEYEGDSIAHLFAPYNTNSPFYGQPIVGCEITYNIIVEWEDEKFVFPQFVGNVRSVTPNREDNTVEITALDRVEILRKPIQLPPWAMSQQHVAWGELNSQLCYSHWVIDNALRHCKTSSTGRRPVTREERGIFDDSWMDGVQFWATCNGSYVPTIGWLDNVNADTFPNESQPMYQRNGPVHPRAEVQTAKTLGFNGLGMPLSSARVPAGKGYIRYWAADRDLINPYATHYMCMTLNTNGSRGDDFQTIGPISLLEVMIGDHYALYISVEAGQVWTQRYFYQDGYGTPVTQIIQSSRVDIPVGFEHVHVWAQWDNTDNTGSRCQIRCESEDGTVVNDTGWVAVADMPGVGPADQIKGRVSIGQALSMSDVGYSVRNIFGGAASDFDELYKTSEYIAYIDEGINRFSHMPGHKPEEAWKLITEVAAAEYGSVLWDEVGSFHFWNYDTMKAKQAEAVREVTLDHAAQLRSTETLDSVRNIYQVEAARKRSLFEGKIYESSDVNEFYVPGRTTKFFRLWVDDVLSPLTFFMQKYATTGTPNWPAWSDSVNHGYVIQYYQLVGSEVIWTENNARAGVDVGVYFDRNGFLTVRVYNGWDEPIRFASGGYEGTPSNPAFRLTGTAILDSGTQPFQVKNRGSIETYGPRIHQLEGEWYQDVFASGALMTVMMERTANPIPVTDDIVIPGDPRLQLGDCLDIKDPDGFGALMRAQIYGISREYDIDKGLEDVLTVEMVRPPTDPGDNPTEPEPVVGAPQNLTAAPNEASQSVYLNWDDLEGASAYTIYSTWWEDNVVIEGDHIVGQETNSESTRGPLKMDATYEYWVTAFINGVETEASNVVTVVLGTDSSPSAGDPIDESPPDPNVPQNFTATPNQTDRTIQLQWDDVAGASAYNIRSNWWQDDVKVSGPTLNEQVTVSESLRGPLETNSTYEYWITSIVDGIESEATPHAIAVLGTDSTDLSDNNEPPPDGGGGDPGSSVVPSTATLLFAGDYNTGDFSQWGTIQQEGYNSGPDGYTQNYRAQVVNDGPGHETAARFEVRSGDVPDFGGGERSEVRGGPDVFEGDERWYEFDLKFDSNFQGPNNGWCIVMQWHAGSGSPPMCLEASDDGWLMIQNNETNFRRQVASLDPGVWHRYTLHVRFSDSDGWVEIWRDGQLIHSRFSMSNMSSGSNYHKQGIYRDSESHTQVVYHDGLRIYAP